MYYYKEIQYNPKKYEQHSLIYVVQHNHLYEARYTIPGVCLLWTQTEIL